MTDQRTDEMTAVLPDGTDTVIEGAARSSDGDTVNVEDTALITEREIPAPKRDAERPVTGSGSAEGGLVHRLRSGREQLAGQAGEKARGFVTQGLERTSEALAKVYARAEIGLAKAIAAAKGKALAIPAAMFGVAFICALAAVTALAVGVVLALETFIGPLAAGFVGMLIFAAIAGLLGWAGYSRLRRDL